MGSEDTITLERRLHGVHGWLLVLCLYLMVLIPVLAVLGLLGAWQGASRSPTLQNALVFEAAFEFALAVFGFYAGLALYQKRPNAVVIAKVYFIVMLTLGVLVLGIVLLGLVAQFSDPALAKQLRGPAMAAALREIILSGVWLLYLERSERVRATYPEG
jgi:Kef-type K+ transport system membrane component KefB